MDEAKLQMLLDRMEITDTINRYATSVDTCDWELFLTCYTDEMGVDMTSIGFEKPITMPATGFLEMIKTAVSGFDSTQHIVSNHTINIDGDSATCVSYLQAQHFSQDDLGVHTLTIGGYYSNSLIRTPDGWRINKYKVTKTWMTSS